MAVDKPPSDEATTAFVRRTLCSHRMHNGNANEDSKGDLTTEPLTDFLPPLTSSNAVDLQLYALIAINIKDFVQTWYSKITPDHAFVDEVLQIIAHCTRGLEQRLRAVDLESLLLDEIPSLLDDHLRSEYMLCSIVFEPLISYSIPSCAVCKRPLLGRGPRSPDLSLCASAPGAISCPIA